ncbi:MAG: choice-of-anchor Q domain-containing protein [Verrucomicrobiales bacterium]|nr:choice-of-anchor Q domain-containing protein [Verrucomicrobiales bacterium]
MPKGEHRNITNAPRFVGTNGWSNLRLQSNSPCINAGNNACVVGTADLDGNPRIVAGSVDIGAYECQSPSSKISYAWLQRYRLPINTNADSSDTDGDGMNNWQEWRCGTVPTNASSVLKMLAPAYGTSGLIVRWQSVSNRTYFLERSTNLGAQPRFHTLATNIAGQTPTTSYPDTNAVGPGPFFYRVGVQQ